MFIVKSSLLGTSQQIIQEVYWINQFTLCIGSKLLPNPSICEPILTQYKLQLSEI